MRRLKPVSITLVAVLIAALVVVFLPAQSAQAAVIRSFTPVFQSQANGAIGITGNMLLTCPPSATCTDALSNATAANGNNQFNMVMLDADNDASTTNSSGATVNIPAGATVLHASLYWGAATVAGNGGVAASGNINQLRLRTPGTSSYQTITASNVDQLGAGTNRDYSARADITNLVRNAGAGMYWGANIAAATGQDRYGAWSIVIAYQHPNLPLRDLTVFNGYASVTDTETVTTSISGFLTPAAGTVNAQFGTVTYEGDTQITGDYLAVGSTRLADDLSRSANFFASRVTASGQARTDRVPANLNNMAIDAKIVNAPNVVPNGATSTNVTFGTAGDFYYPAVLTSQIDLYAPTIVGTKSVTNLNGNAPARVGDILDYTLTFSNTGQDPAQLSVMTDQIPAGTAYVPGSIRGITGTTTTPLTDTAGDDRAEFADNTVTARIGTGATATQGGTLAPGASTTVRFQVRVLDAAAGNTITNSAQLAYRAQTLAKSYTYQTNEVSTPVAALADVSIAKTAPATATAGANLTYTLSAANAGPSAANDVVVTDTLPEGLTFVSASESECSASGQVVTCPLGSLAANATRQITIVAAADASLAAGSKTNTASISTSTADRDPSNNTSAATSSVVLNADVRLAKSVDSATVVPGRSVTWTLTATNGGPSTARDVVITDTVPAGMTVTAQSDGCTVTVRDVSCAVGDLAPGATRSVTVTTQLSAAWRSTEAMRNAGAVQSSTPDLNTANNRAAATVTPVAPVADIGVSKQIVGSVVAGSPVTYRMTVTNAGPSRSRDVTVTDALPEGLSNPSFSTDSGSCSAEGRTVTCALGEMPVGGTATVTVTALLASSASGTLENTAMVASVGDPNDANNTATVLSPVTRTADLSLTKTANAAIAGHNVTFTLGVHNAGPSDALNTVVTDTLPAGVSYQSASGATCSAVDQQVTCSLDTVEAGSAASFTIVGAISADAVVADIVNTASVTSQTDDPDTANNTASTTVPLSTSADVSIEKVAPDSLTAGTNGQWTLTVRNAGPSVAQNVNVAESLPAGVTLLAMEPSIGTCNLADATCALGALEPNATVTIVVTAAVAADYSAAAAVNTATVTTDTAESTTSNNSATTRTPVITRANLSIAKSGPVDGEGDPAAVVAGETISWELTLGNAGPSLARSVSVTDTLPEGTSYVSYASDDGVTCESAGPRAVTCSLESLAVDATATVTVTANIAPYLQPGTNLRNAAAIGSATPEDADDQGDDTASATNPVAASADLSVTKHVDPTPLIAGSPATYTIRVQNAGPSTAQDVVVTDVLPGGLTPVSAQGPGACTVSGQTVSCAVGSIAPGGGNTVQIDVMVIPTAAGSTIENQVSVDSATFDPDRTNNTASVQSQVQSRADVSISKSADRTAIAAGEAVTYTLVAINNGPSAADDVVIRDVIPDGMAFVTASDDCTVSGAEVECAIGTLAAAEAATVQLTLRVPQTGRLGDYDNTATVATSSTDPNTGNNTSSATVTVGSQADLELVKTASSDVAVAGRPLAWRIVLTNHGPSAATGVTVSDTVPDSLAIVDASAPGATCEVDGQNVSCVFGTVLTGDVVVTVNTTVRAGAAGDSIENIATVSTETPDPNQGNETATATVPLSQQADLRIAKSIVGGAPVPGADVEFSLVATNDGPSASSDVVISDLLPEGLTDVRVTATDADGNTVACTVTPVPYVDGGEVQPNSGLVRCAFGDLDAASVVRATVQARLSPSFVGELSNTATVGATTLDPDGSNNEASVTTPVGVGPVEPTPTEPAPTPSAPTPSSPAPSAPGDQPGLPGTGAEVPGWLLLMALAAAAIGAGLHGSRRRAKQ